MKFPKYYYDNGCRFHSACLECPEPVCRLDMKHQTTYERNKQVMILIRNGYKISHIATHFGISERTVLRIVKRQYVPIKNR